MYCTNCNSELRPDSNFCHTCGNKIAEHAHADTEIKTEPKEEPKQKSFKLDMSKKANINGLIAIGFVILLKLLGSLVGSYLVAGLILGILFAVIGFYFNKKS